MPIQVTEESRRISFRVSLPRKKLDALDAAIEKLNTNALGQFDRRSVLEGLVDRFLKEQGQ